METLMETLMERAARLKVATSSVSQLLAEIERARAQRDVAVAGMQEAVSHAEWQKRTNHELNQINADNERLRGELRVLRGSHDWISSEKARLESAIQRTIDENGHLADGDNCTLAHLVRAMPTTMLDSTEEQVDVVDVPAQNPATVLQPTTRVAASPRAAVMAERDRCLKARDRFTHRDDIEVAQAIAEEIRVPSAEAEQGNAGLAPPRLDWLPVETPPAMSNREWWPTSEVVLVFEKDGTIRTATFEQVDGDAAPYWYSADSERWGLDTVTHWMPLPLPPTI